MEICKMDNEEEKIKSKGKSATANLFQKPISDGHKSERVKYAFYAPFAYNQTFSKPHIAYVVRKRLFCFVCFV